MKLKELFTIEVERAHIERVAISTYNVGIKNMCASYAAPKKKKNIIDEYFDSFCHNGGILYNCVARIPLLFSIGSTLISPFVRFFLAIKRRIKGRQ